MAKKQPASSGVKVVTPEYQGGNRLGVGGSLGGKKEPKVGVPEKIATYKGRGRQGGGVEHQASYRR